MSNLPLNFGTPMPRDFMTDEYNFFIEEINFKLNVMLAYLIELNSFYDEKKISVLENFKKLDLEKSALGDFKRFDPNFFLYSGDFKRLTISNIYVSLFSYFEYCLIDFISHLEKYFNVKENQKRVVNNKFIKKTKPNINTILEMGYYLSTFYEKPNRIKNDIEMFKDAIVIRNAIVHNGSRIIEKKMKSLVLYFDIIYNNFNGYFEFKDLISCHHTVKSMKTFFNSLHLYKLCDTLKP